MMSQGNTSTSELLLALQLEEPLPLFPGNTTSSRARERRLICTIIRIDKQFSGDCDHELVMPYPPRSIAAFVPHMASRNSKHSIFPSLSRQKLSADSLGLNDAFNIAMSFMRKVQQVEIPHAGTKRPNDYYPSSGGSASAGNQLTGLQQGRCTQAQSSRPGQSSEKGRERPGRQRAPILASTSKKARVDNHEDCFPDFFWAHDPHTYADCIWDCSFDHTYIRKFDDYRVRSLDNHWKWGDFHREGLNANRYRRAIHAKTSRTVPEPERSRQKWLLTRQILFGTSLSEPIPTCPGRAVRHNRRRKQYELPSRSGHEESDSDQEDNTASGAVENTTALSSNVVSAPEVAAANLISQHAGHTGPMHIPQQQQLMQISEMSEQFRRAHRSLWEAFNGEWTFPQEWIFPMIERLSTMTQSANDQARTFANELMLTAFRNGWIMPMEFAPLTDLQNQLTAPAHHGTIENSSSMRDETTPSDATPQTDQAPATDPTTPGSAMVSKGSMYSFNDGHLHNNYDHWDPPGPPIT